MSISRRDFFRQLFSPKTIRSLSPVPARELTSLLGLGAAAVSGDPESAGLLLSKTNRKRSAAVDAAAQTASNREGPTGK